MKTSHCFSPAIFLVLVLMSSCVTYEPIEIQPVGNANCDNVAARGSINILNINVMFDEIDNRQNRFEQIADFVASNDVDVIFIQEIVKGGFFKTENSAEDLRGILLARHNLDFNVSTAWEVGDPASMASANAILSRCEIAYSEYLQLPFVVKIEKILKFGKRAPRPAQSTVQITQNVQAASIDIPGRGKMNLYNTHLCAKTDIDGRAEQLNALLKYIKKMEAGMPADNPSALGGDFNFDLFDNNGAERFMWEKIINTGFIDAYADYQIKSSNGGESLDTICELEDQADEHCTVGVSELDGHNARRVDYIFTWDPSTVLRSEIVFNPLVNEEQATVSDHAGVLISLRLR